MTALIPDDLVNEINCYKLKKEHKKMLAGFNAVKKCIDYHEEITEIEQLDGEESWWKN
jgi:hypothetical protein